MRKSIFFVLFLIVAVLVVIALAAVPTAVADNGGPPETVRFATYNASLNRFNAGVLADELSSPGSPQPDAVAEIIQITRPDVLLINEFDYDAGGVAAQGFQDNYLSVPHGSANPIYYPYWFIAPSNTGTPSGVDLDNSGSIGGPNDAFGFGFFPGQFGMVVYSMYPIDYSAVRTFQNFLWKDMPGALVPTYPDGTSWYSPEALSVFRLSSKSHWDIPISVGNQTVHFLTSHPTPPVFDDPPFYPPGVDFNGKRNHDEIRFWADYIIPSRSGYIYDDAGNWGGLTPGDPFVIAGDQNSDPVDGDSIPGSAQLLLDHPLVNTRITPDSLGGPEQADLQGGINDAHTGDPAYDTADFGDFAPGNLRVDYVLPKKNLRMDNAGVFWPLSDDPHFPLIGASDHRLVWIDVFVPSAK